MHPYAIIIAPRWGGTLHDDWYPWLSNKLIEKLGERLDALEVVQYVEPNAPEIADLVLVIEQLVGRIEKKVNLVMVGHSVGCQAILQYLSRHHVHVKGLLLVAGWFTVDEGWPELEPWLNTELDPGRIRKSCQDINVLISDNDPFTANYKATAEAFNHKLDATVEIFSGAAHFNKAEQPEVWQALEGVLHEIDGG